MSFEGWWRRILLIGRAVGHVIGFGIGCKILLSAIHHPSTPWLLLVALTLMGAGAYPMQRALEVIGRLIDLLTQPPTLPPSEPDRGSLDSSADGSPPAQP